MTKRPSRRTQAERSSATRSALLDAAIGCIFEHGYGATTTTMVIQRAGVSRGAMLHHFPSKADLMAFVVEEVHEESVRIYKELLAEVDDPRLRLLDYPEASWRVNSRPAGIAVLEILLASRSDPMLAARIAPVIEKNEKNAMQKLRDEFHQPSIALVHLVVGCIRGLTVTKMLAPQEDVTEALSMLQRMLHVSWDAGAFHEIGRLNSGGPVIAGRVAQMESS